MEAQAEASTRFDSVHVSCDATWWDLLDPNDANERPREARLVGLLLAAKLGVLVDESGRTKVVKRLQGLRDDADEEEGSSEGLETKRLQDPFRWLRAPLKSSEEIQKRTACSLLSTLLQDKRTAKMNSSQRLLPLLVDACREDGPDGVERRRDAWRCVLHLLEAYPEGEECMESIRKMHCIAWERLADAIDTHVDARAVARILARRPCFCKGIELSKQQAFLEHVIDRLLDLLDEAKHVELEAVGASSIDPSNGVAECRKQEDLFSTLDAILAMPSAVDAIRANNFKTEKKAWNVKTRKIVAKLLRECTGRGRTHALRIATVWMEGVGSSWILEGKDPKSDELLLCLSEMARIEAHVAAQAQLRRQQSNVKEDQSFSPETEQPMHAKQMSSNEADSMELELLSLSSAMMEQCMHLLATDSSALPDEVIVRVVSTVGRFADDMAEYLGESREHCRERESIQLMVARALARVLAEIPSAAPGAARALLMPCPRLRDSLEGSQEKSRGASMSPCLKSSCDTSSGLSAAEEQYKASMLEYVLSLHHPDGDGVPAVAFFLPWMLLLASDAEWDGSQGALLLLAGSIHGIIMAVAKPGMSREMQDNACSVALLLLMTTTELKECRQNALNRRRQELFLKCGRMDLDMEPMSEEAVDREEEEGILWTPTCPEEDDKKRDIRNLVCQDAMVSLPVLLEAMQSPVALALCSIILLGARNTMQINEQTSEIAKQVKYHYQVIQKKARGRPCIEKVIAQYYFNKLSAHERQDMC